MSLAPWRRFSIVSWTSLYLSVSLGLWLPAPVLARSLPAPIIAAETTGLATLKNDIVTMAAGAGGVLGVAAWRLDGKGPKVLLNPDERFPMASTVKVAVARAVLSMVIVVAIFIKKSTASLETREQVIADIARSIRDYFLYV
jgi:hypothetical protein